MHTLFAGSGRAGRLRFWMYELIFVGPILFSFILVKIIPLAITVLYSFTEWNGIASLVTYSGASNYRSLLGDKQYWTSLWFTLRFSFLSVILGNVFGFLLAMTLSKALKLRNFMRAGFYVPNTIGGLVLGFVWRFIFIQGFANLYKLTGIGFFGLGWLSTPATSFWAMIIVEVWRLSGYLMLLYIAGISVIPGECLESARMDGASGLQLLRHVTIPLLMPTITRCLFLSFLTCMRIYDVNIALTGGGPYRSSETITYNVYLTAFNENKMGYGCAKALVFILIVVALSLLQVHLTSKKEVEV